MTGRREELAELATDYALEYGLIGLSLRPLAEALGTSDRMLLYHFADKDDLLVTILQTTSDRSVESLRGLPPPRDVRGAVLDLWREVTSGVQQRCLRLYVEAAALGLFGREPYASAVRQTNEEWGSAVAHYFARAGLSRATARQATRLVDATFMGLLLDQPLHTAAGQRRAVRDLADAVEALWGRPSVGTRQVSQAVRSHPRRARADRR